MRRGRLKLTTKPAAAAAAATAARESLVAADIVATPVAATVVAGRERGALCRRGCADARVVVPRLVSVQGANNGKNA